MSVIPPDENGQGDGGAPKDEQELGTAPTMLYMKPVAEAEATEKAIEKAAEDMGGETLLMMPAISGATTADEDDAPPEQGPAAGPLPEGEGLAELDSADTMMYMPAVGATGAPDSADTMMYMPAVGAAGAPDGDSAPSGGFSDEVQKKLAQLKDTLGDSDVDEGASTVAYMPAVGNLPMDQAMDRMMAKTGEASVRQPAASPEKPRVPTEPAFPAVSPTPAAPPSPSPAQALAPKVSPTPAVKPGPDLDDDLDDDDFAALTGKRKGGKIFLILFLLILLGVGGVFVAILFDLIPGPEFLDSMTRYTLDL